MQLTKNTKRPWKTTLLASLLTVLCAGAALAQQMNYQGRLTDTNGTAVADAQYAITFDIYDSATAGTSQWGPQVIPADTVQGRFNVILGPTDAISRNIVDAFNGGTKFLQITFQGTPILPRQQILSSPTAFFAQQAGQLASVFVLNGNVGVGTTNPVAKLDVAVPDAGGIRITGPGGNGSTIALDLSTYHPGSDGPSSRIVAADDNYSSSLDFQTKIPGAAANALASRMTISSGGDIGIGATTPSLKLQVNGKNGARTTTDANGYIAMVPGGSDSAGYLEFHKSGPTRIAYLGYNSGGINNLGLNLEAGANFNINGGNVGIGLGTGTPSGKLDVAGDAYLGGASTGSRFKIGNNVIQQFNNGVAAPMFLNPSGGTVILGPSGASQARLVVNSSSSFNLGGFSDYFTLFGNLQERRDTGNLNVSVWASGIIAGLAIHAFSDERIKSIEGRSDASRDLKTLLGIEVTDYTYIDTLSKGTGQHKKVIAQQVEKVFPQAVSKSADVVPDIYQKAEVKDGWVQLATNLKPGERVRLIGEKQEGIHEVLEVAAGRFRTDFMVEGNKVFVFGREVQDFRSVDYEAVAMLNVSATQELARRLEKLEARATHLADLEQKAGRVATLEQEVAELKKMVAQLAKAGKDTEQAAQATTTSRPAAAAPVRKTVTTASLGR